MMVPGTDEDKMRSLPKAILRLKNSNALLLGQMYLYDLRPVRANAADGGKMELLELSSFGIHPAFAHLSAHHTGGNARLARQLQRVLSALVFWQPSLAFSTALPRLALPFVTLCGSNTLACFEVLATVLRNWAPAAMNSHCGHNTRQLKAIAYLLQLYDRQLYLIVNQGAGGLHEFMQPIVSTLLVDISPQSQWLQVWDVLLANSPKLFSFLVVAIVITQRKLLLAASQEGNLHISSCLSHLDVDKVLRLAINLRKKRPEKETALVALPQCSSYTCNQCNCAPCTLPEQDQY
ncbi:probable TBC1 domain family member 31 [Coccomyxa sp. Obi]|nr:probable TBC1 domain family member 31 [Coccomyxa sp. Obi]